MLAAEPQAVSTVLTTSGGSKCPTPFVPAGFVTANLSKLALRDNDRVSLFLSAEPADLFVERRGTGKLSFAPFRVS